MTASPARPGPERVHGAAGLPVAPVLAFAAVVELLLQSMRALFPLGYHLVGSLGFVVTPLLLAAVFLAPLLVAVMLRLLGARAGLLLAVALIAARVVLQAAPVLAAAVLATVVGLLAVTAVLPRLAGLRFAPDAVAAGTLVGLGLDVALRSWRVTDDVVWSVGWSAWLDPSLLVPVLLLAVTARSLTGRAEHRPGAWTWFVLLMPQLLLWTSLAFVGSSGAVGLPVATAVLLGATALAMAVLAWPAARLPWPVSAAAVLAATIGMPWLAGWPVLVLAALGTVASPLLLREAVARASALRWSPARYAASAGAGSIAMFALLLAYPLHYEFPLPVDNRVIPGFAVALSLLPMLRRRPSEVVAREFATPTRIHAPAIAFVGAGALGLAAMVQVGVVGGSPLPGPDPALAVGSSTPGELRVATYNLGQGQDAESGKLALRRVAEAVVGLDADLVAVQELARGWPLTSMTDMDAWLRAHTDLTVVFAPAADRQFGNAVMARVPIEQVVDIDLGKGGGAQRRSAQRVALPDGVTVYGMHLQARNSEAAEQTRLAQMQQIVDDWAGLPATVVVGDLNPRNEYADETETPPKVVSNLEVFTDAGLRTTQPTQRCTEPTSNDNCSDYAFTSPDVALVSPTEVLDVEVSDHRPVLARVAPRRRAGATRRRGNERRGCAGRPRRAEAGRPARRPAARPSRRSHASPVSLGRGTRISPGLLRSSVGRAQTPLPYARVPMAEEPWSDLPVDPDVARRPDRISHPRRWDIALAIAAGGAVGGTMRHAVSIAVPNGPDGFPWGTLLENVSGALLLALLVVFVVEVWRPSRYLRPFLATGVLGGYTTFSTLMNETRELLLDGDAVLAFVYVSATLVLGLLATLLGLALGRRVARGRGQA